MFVFTLVVIGGLLLLFRSTRLAGIAGLTLLSLIYPWLFLTFLLVANIAIFIYHKRRKHEFIPRLPIRRR